MNKEHRAKRRIFIVDDEQMIAWTLSMILNQAGYDAKAFYNPHLLLAEALKSAPDLVISDVVMREMTGIQLALEIQKNLLACKIILFSGQAETSELLKLAEERGHAFDVLAKPIQPAILLNVIRCTMNPIDPHALFGVQAPALFARAF